MKIFFDKNNDKLSLKREGILVFDTDKEEGYIEGEWKKTNFKEWLDLLLSVGTTIDKVLSIILKERKILK